MRVSRFDQEVESYLAATRTMRLNEDRAFDAFTALACEVLSLVRDRWPSDAAKWVDSIRESRGGALSEADCLQLQRSLTSFRADILGEPGGMDVNHSDESAFVFLVQLAVEAPSQSSSSAYRGTALARLMDEFAVEFIEHFGKADVVVSLIKQHF